MADLASSFSSFLFPEGFQPLDGCEELDSDAFLKSALENETKEYRNSIAFQKPLDVNTCLEVGKEVAITMEPEDLEETPSTPNKPPTHLSCLSPLTPTANLKVLISAASPEIRFLASKRQKKALFNAIADHASCLQEAQGGMIEEEVVEIECLSQGDDGAEDGNKPINRKSKSLGLLCQRFLSRYPHYPENGVAMAISLDAISKELGVERRRIYDIVNVLESIEMVSRVAKNKYLWHGKMNMESTLARLKCLGEKKRYSDQIVHLKKLQIQNEYSDELEHLTKQPFRDISNISNQDPEDKKEVDRFDEDMNNRRDKSLGVMSQKFIMLFLVSQAKVITLDIAARVLIGDINYEIREGSKFKTKVRRLYDIANILTSLEMIQKVHVQEGRGRKPAFRWIGPNPDTSQVHLSDVHIENAAPSRQSFFSTPAAPLPTTPQETKPSPTSYSKATKKVPWSRHASFNAICEVVERERRSYSSAPNSPVKDSRGEVQVSTPIDEKFRQDFEALRSKYPDQMSKIYVSEKQAGQDVIQEDKNTPTRDCPVVSVPLSSPKCTPGSTAGFAPFNPKVIVSPIPGSLPVSNGQLESSPIPLPLSFNVVKSPPSSSPSGAKDVSDPSQYSLLTNTVNALHMVLRQPDTTRRSKRTIKQPVCGEFEYQPIVKRSKMELEAASALKRSFHDLTNNHTPQGQPQFLKIPVEGNLLKQPTGKPVQTIIIRRDVSVLNKSTSSNTANVAGRGMKARQGTVLPNGRQQVPSQHLTSLMIPGDITSLGKVTPERVASRDTTPQNTTHSPPQAKGSPELTCLESLDDFNVSTSTAQLPFDCMRQEEEGIQQPSVTRYTKQSDKKGLRLDQSNDRKTGIQRNSKVTNGSTKKRGSRHGQHEPTPKSASSGRRSSVARALHLCPEFRNAKITQAADIKDCTGNAAESPHSVSAYLQNERESSGIQCSSKRGSTSGLNCGSGDVLAWSLRNPSTEPVWEDVYTLSSQVEQPPNSESLLRLSRNIVSSSQSHPGSPLHSLGLDGCSNRGDSPKASFSCGNSWSLSHGDAFRLPHASCLSPVQQLQLLPSIQTSEHCLGHAGLVPPLGPQCICRGLYKLSRSSLSSGHCNGSIQAPKASSQTRPVLFSNRPVKLHTSISQCQYPYNRVISRPMSGVKVSSLAGSFFNPLSRSGGICFSLQPDRNLSSPILAQSQDPRVLNPVPMVLASPPGSKAASPYFGYPIFQSTPAAGHQFPSQSPVTPALQSGSATSQGTCRRADPIYPGYRSPRPMSTISGNGLVGVSGCPMLNTLPNQSVRKPLL